MPYFAKQEFNAIYHSLREWYGNERAEREIAAYCPDAISVTAEVDRLMQRIFDKDTCTFMKISDHWEEISGRQIAAVAEPLNFRDGVLRVQVKHPAWLNELKGRVTGILLEKINHVCGEKCCFAIKLAPWGR